jgi:hypothetical protein
MKIPTLLSIVILGCAASLDARAQLTFTDSFNGNSLNATHWTNSTPFSDSSVSVGSGLVSLANGGGILTTGNFSGPLEVAFSFAFTGTAHDSFRVHTRSGGFVGNGYILSGVGVSFRIQEDTGNLLGNIALEDNGVVLQTATVALTANTFYDLRLRDTGSSLALFWGANATPLMTALVTSDYGDHVGAFNREGAGNNSYISAGSVSSLDYLSITTSGAVPEPSTYTLAGAGALLLLAAVRRAKAHRTST